jgi:PAS domain S-box-containing protein
MGSLHEVIGAKMIQNDEISPEVDIFKQLTESITDIFVALNEDLDFTYWNKTAEKIIGITADKVYGKNLLDLFPRIKGSNIEKSYRRVLKSKKSEFFFHNYQLNGFTYLFEINVYPINHGISVLAKDITEWFNSELSIRKSEELFRSTLDNMLEGCAIFDYNWNYVYLNNTHANHALLNREESLGKNLFELVPGFEKSRFFQAYKRTMEDRLPQQVEDCFTFIDGSTHWYEARSIPVSEGVFLLTIEITDRKNYEQELVRYQSILTQAEKMAHLGAWWIDLQNIDDLNANPLKWSEEVYRIFGYKPYSVELTNEFFYNCVHPDDRKRIADEVAKSLSQKIPYSIEYRIIRPDGTQRVVHEHAELKLDEKGNLKCLLGAVQDITEYKITLEDREVLLVNLQKETDTLKTIITSVPDEIWVFNKDGKLQFVNPAVLENLGFDDLESLNFEKVTSELEIRHLDGTIRKPEESALFKSLEGEVIKGDEMVRHLKTGEIHYRHFHSAPMKDNNNEIFGVVVVVSDITERRKIDKRIRELLALSQRRTAELNTILESIPDALFIGTREGMTHVNKKGLELFGKETIEDMHKNVGELSKKFNVRWPDTGIPLKENELQFVKALSGETVVEEVMATNLRTGEDIYLRVAAAPVIENGEVIAAVAVDSDITEMKKSEQIIKASLKEKEVLLRELYHRTKNNMQVISSLLGLKAADINDERTSVILEDMKNRIQTIALVHQKLYQSQNLSRVQIREYITDLTDLLKLSHLIDNKKINFDLEIDDISVLIDTAVPCGLIINELISNSLKYAFPNNKKGTIKISLTRLDEEILELKVSDNGIGVNGDSQLNYNLGLKLIHIIAEDQLQGETTIDTSQGVTWTIKFKDILYDERV